MTRVERLREQATLASEEGCVVLKLTDVRWLSGFTGSNAALLVTNGEEHLFTDGRYEAQVKQEAPGFIAHVSPGNPFMQAVEYAVSRGITSIQVPYDTVTHDLFRQLQDSHPELGLVPSKFNLAVLRAVKDATELETMAEALRITEETFLELQPLVTEGLTEMDLAAEIDYRQRKKGAQKSSFDTIVAFGAQSAFPHARPGKNKLRDGMPILLDFGCVVDGYASDLTRMIHFGEPSADFVHAYQLVVRAVNVATAQAKAGITGKGLDGLARGVFEAENLASSFSHGLGHGVGLEIHEWPSVSARNEQLLPSGCVVTIEPGLYFPGKFGIRLENMVRLDDSGCETLNSLDLKLVVL